MNKKIPMIILVLVMALSLSACGGEETVKNDIGKDNNISTGIEYEIVEKNEINIANAKRYSWEIVVKEKVNVEQLEELSKEIIEIAKKEKSFNAIVIGFYDYGEYIGTGFTLGKVEYAPEGDWAI